MLSLEQERKLGKILCHELDECEQLLGCERLSGGASQETYCLSIQTISGTKKLAMRRAPGGLAQESELPHPGISGEVLLMQAALAAGVPEPEVVLKLKPEHELGEAFIMQWLEGETLGARIARGDKLAALRPQLAYQCGQVLARIHAIDLQQSGLDKILHRATPQENVQLTWDRYKALNTAQPMIDFSARWLLKHLPGNPRSCLVHSDFRNGNLMIGPQGIEAVLDWELAYIGDPMRDLGWICTNSWRFGVSNLPVGGFGSREDLFKGYQDECGIEVAAEEVKFWEVYGSFWWAIGCLGMAEHYRNGPDKSVERPAIARRTSECQMDCVNLLIPGLPQLVKGEALTNNSELPRVDELLVSVRDFLKNDLMHELQGRSNFLSRVSANALDIVQRDMQLGTQARAQEHTRLGKLLNGDDNLHNLRWQLVNDIRSNKIALNNPELCKHLRQTVANQLAIDQPRYSALKTALSFT